MTDTTVSLLTPPGTGAIATVEVRGPRVWELARHLFTPAGKPLPESPEVNRFWFGTLGSDEVVLAVTKIEAPLHPPGLFESAATSPPPCGGEVVVAAQPVSEAKVPAAPQPLPHRGGGEVAASRARGAAAGEGGFVFPTTLEVHCHGGRGVVRWIIEQFLSHGCVEVTRTQRPPGAGFELLQRAPTLRTASIILDQLNGAFTSEVQRLLRRLETDPGEAHPPLARLAELGNTVGRHLVEPWKVVVAGPPNVGKSSLINALAGFQRSVVSEVAGTTRDAVSVRTAFDGWPVELIDTAGMREAEGLEADGIERARSELERAELVLWVVDGTAPAMVWAGQTVPVRKLLTVINKSDALMGRGIDPDARNARGAILASALTGEGVGVLVAEISRRLVPNPPHAGAAVPFTPQLAERIEAASVALGAGQTGDAARRLREALALLG